MTIAIEFQPRDLAAPPQWWMNDYAPAQWAGWLRELPPYDDLTRAKERVASYCSVGWPHLLWRVCDGQNSWVYAKNGSGKWQRHWCAF